MSNQCLAQITGKRKNLLCATLCCCCFLNIKAEGAIFFFFVFLITAPSSGAFCLLSAEKKLCLVSCKVKDEKKYHESAKLGVLMVSDVLSVFELLVVFNRDVFT